MSILGQKGGKFGPKRVGPVFSWTSNINFPQEDHKISIYTKNQQNSMNRLENISSNVNFGPKTVNLDQKGPIKGGPDFS